ncbi:MAG: ATP-binding protein [Cyanobacteriota bacterium]
MPDKINILIVDDNPGNLFTLETILNNAELNIVKASSGEEALKCVLKSDFAVIILDVQMPGMDGFETAEVIRSREKSKFTPLIFVTGVGQSDLHIDKGYSLGAIDYILKPIKPEGLKTKLSVLIDLYKNKKMLEQKTMELERSNKELEHFAYVASHDLQEPLRSVTSHVQLLSMRYKGKLGEDADDFINFAVEGTTRMKALINDLLSYSRIGTRGKPFEKIDTTSTVKIVLDNLETSIEKAEAIITYDNLPEIFADPTQMIQLFQNLIGNAIKFKGENPPEVHISAYQSGEEWIFSVKDNGIGISSEFFDRIFVIFQRLHNIDEYSGTGIGLSVCKKIVERHGGKIYVESELEKGSKFIFSFPIHTLKGY